jgi:hypothetical protein
MNAVADSNPQPTARALTSAGGERHHHASRFVRHIGDEPLGAGDLSGRPPSPDLGESSRGLMVTE